MAYYLLTVLEQDSGAEVQRCVKDLHRGHVRRFSSFQVFGTIERFPQKDDSKASYTPRWLHRKYVRDVYSTELCEWNALLGGFDSRISVTVGRGSVTKC